MKYDKNKRDKINTSNSSTLAFTVTRQAWRNRPDHSSGHHSSYKYTGGWQDWLNWWTSHPSHKFSGWSSARHYASAGTHPGGRSVSRTAWGSSQSPASSEVLNKGVTALWDYSQLIEKSRNVRKTHQRLIFQWYLITVASEPDLICEQCIHLRRA
jgi:hypothetical protein